MRRLPPKYVVHLTFVLLLVLGQSAGIVHAQPAPARTASSAAIQAEPGFLPGFAEPSGDVEVVATSTGDLDPAIGEPASLTIERLRIAPGDEVPTTEGAQIIEVEHGTLSYTDDLGLDAELQSDTSAYFAAGSATPITNDGSVPAIVLRTTLNGAAAEPVGTSEGTDDSETGERPTPTADDPVGNSNVLGMARDISSSQKAITSAATPSASPVAATPAAGATPEPTTAPVSTAKLGVLLQADLTDLPASAQQFFAAELVLQPGAELTLTESTGPIGLIANGGDLTVERDGRTPAKLRDGRSVVLPTGTSATLVNDGDTPLTLHVAGISGETASTPPVPEETAVPDNEPSGNDEGPIDVSGPHRFIPSDSEMEHLGLFVMPGQAQESTDASANTLWFTSGSEANDKLTEYDWQDFVLDVYSSNDEATDYGAVNSLALNVDTFADSDGATGFYNYIRDEIFQGGASHSRDLSQLNGVDAEMRDSLYNSTDKLDYGFMVIRSGQYVISLYVRGSDLNTIGLLEAVAKLIFGPRG